MRHTRAWLAVALVAVGAALAACDFPGLSALDEAAMSMAEQARVADVRCAVDSLSLEIHEASVCAMFNEHGTRIEFDGWPVPAGGWRSSNFTAVSIALDGTIRAETVVDTVWIVAEGTFGSADSVQVWSY